MNLLSKVLNGYVLLPAEVENIENEVIEIDNWLDMDIEEVSLIDSAKERLNYLQKVLVLSEKNILKGRKVMKKVNTKVTKEAEIVDMFTVLNNAKKLQDLTAKYQKDGDEKYFDKKVAHLNLVMEQLQAYQDSLNKKGA
jgi:hypothetical protein